MTQVVLIMYCVFGVWVFAYITSYYKYYNPFLVAIASALWPILLVLDLIFDLENDE